MGGGRGAGNGGRYEEKGGGQQVSSFFAEATDNEKIIAIYGNYSLWSWLRYWWLDTENYVTFMLMDKGYYDYDYDYERPSAKTRDAITAAKSDDELEAKLRGMGFDLKRRILTPAELQAEVMREEEKKGTK